MTLGNLLQFRPPSHFKYYRERTKEKNYVRIKKIKEGCKSVVGMDGSTRVQLLWLSHGCVTNSTDDSPQGSISH